MGVAWVLHGCCMGVAWVLNGCCMSHHGAVSASTPYNNNPSAFVEINVGYLKN